MESGSPDISPISANTTSTHGDCGSCKMNLKLGDKGVISTSSGPDGSYLKGLQCLWLLSTVDDSRIRLSCDRIELTECKDLGRDSPDWQDYLVISPTWAFRKSWVYCGHATKLKTLTHTSICQTMAVAFRSDENADESNKGFHCTYEAIPAKSVIT